MFFALYFVIITEIKGNALEITVNLSPLASLFIVSLKKRSLKGLLRE